MNSGAQFLFHIAQNWADKPRLWHHLFRVFILRHYRHPENAQFPIFSESISSEIVVFNLLHSRIFPAYTGLTQ